MKFLSLAAPEFGEVTTLGAASDDIFVKMMTSVAYRYRKSISIIELFVSIYIDIYRVLGN